MLIKDVDIVTEETVLHDGYIVIENGRIKDFGRAEAAPAGGVSLTGLIVMPGFIDTHVHGTKGDDFSDANPQANNRISENLVKEGVSGFLATTTTMSEEDVLRALEALAESSSPGAKNLGIHLEGPFINAKFKGAQNESHIQKGDMETFKRLQKAARGLIRIITLAPEVQDEAFLEALAREDVIISMGHSDAKAADVKKALSLGISRVTHCFNAMRGIHHRDLGLAGMALAHDEIMAEVIADNIHLAPDTLRLLEKTKGADGITLVSDAIRAKGLEDGTYSLGGLDVVVRDGVARLTDDALAGSTLRMDEALANMKKAADATLPALARMLSFNPAKTLGIADETGSIAIGKAADLVFLDDGLAVKKTMVDGQIVFDQ